MSKFRYSTAPIENVSGTMYANESFHYNASVLAVNNSRKKKAKFTITLYQLTDAKTEFTSETRALGPQESMSVDLNTAGLDRFIIEISGKQKGRSQVLFSVTGKDEGGSVNYMLPLINLRNNC
ncbi:hypothetical protein V7138_09035 [Bacillus sp. JJ1533]|uniref:hypothetical protein n=1 Tax=Bacillus sp. JJ1533 TaxID=3122959 RepID=UPI002FFFFD7E